MKIINLYCLFRSIQIEICRTPDNENGYCVLLDHCTTISSLITPNMTSEDRIYLSKSLCAISHDEQKVCCLPDKTDEIRTERRFNIFTEKLPSGSRCSYRIANRILGGRNTKINDYPFVALLKYSKRK